MNQRINEYNWPYGGRLNAVPVLVADVEHTGPASSPWVMMNMTAGAQKVTSAVLCPPDDDQSEEEQS